MKGRFALRVPALLFAAAGLGCVALAWATLTGAFAATGLPESVTGPRALVYGLMSAGWLFLACAAWQQRCRGAAWLGYFMAGMGCWDAITTSLLADLPVPPGHHIWAPLAIAALVGAAHSLRYEEVER